MIKNIKYFVYQSFNERSVHEKETFYASDYEKPAWELYHGFIGTPRERIRSSSALRMELGNVFEDVIIDKLRNKGECITIERAGELGFVIKSNQIYARASYRDIVISGRMDGMSKNLNPIECKSGFGYSSLLHLQKREPKDSYMFQLGFYQYYMVHILGMNSGRRGYLIFADRATGEIISFTQEYDGNFGLKIYYRNKLCKTLDMKGEFDRWNSIYLDYVLVKKEPPFSEYKPAITESFLVNFSDNKIKDAIKKDIILSKSYYPKYSSYRKLSLRKEATSKRCSVRDLYHYTKAEKKIMLAWIDSEIKNGRIYKKK